MKTTKIIGWVLLIGGLIGAGYFVWPMLHELRNASKMTSGNLESATGLLISTGSAFLGFVLLNKK